MSVLNRKLRRELRASAGLLLAIVGIIAVGVACLVTIGSAYMNLADAKRRYYEQCRMADFSIELKKAPLTELSRLREMREIAEIRFRLQHYVTVDLEGVPEPINGLVLSLPDQQVPVINDIVVRQGSYFTDRRDNEVIVNEAFARYYHLRPGQWIRLLLNNQQQELFVVGTCISSEFVYLLGSGTITPDPKHFGVFYVKRTYAEDVFDFKGSANQVLGRLNPLMEAGTQEVLRRAEAMLEPYGVFSTTPLEDQMSNKFLSQEIHGLRSFAFVTPSMFLAVAALVLNVLLTRLAQQQRTVIGTLKALGYSDAQVFWHFLKVGLSVGVVGGLSGCILGWWLSAGMTAIYRTFFQFPELTNRFHPSVHGIGMLVSVGCAMVGSFLGSRAVLRLQPAEAMRPRPPRQGGVILLERVGWFWRRLGSEWRMVLRNLFRSRLRSAASIFAAAMGASVMFNGFMMQRASQYLVDFQFRWVLRSDVDLMFKDERGMEALGEAAGLPGVDRAEPLLTVACTFTNGPYRKKGAVTGLLPGAQLTIPRDGQGRKLRVPSHGLAISRTLAASLRLDRGDLVTVEPVKGLRRVQHVPVTEISDSYLGTAVYADLHYLSHLIDEEAAVNGVQLATDQNPDQRELLYRELKQMPVLQAVTARSDMIESLEETVLKNQGIIIGLLVGFAGIVFFGSILNASLVSLAERQRELATLRVLGYGPWQIGSLLTRESLITTLAGTMLGMPLGYLLSYVTAEAYASDMFRLPLVAPPEIWIWTVVLAVVFALATQLVVQRAIHRMDWLDALKVQE